MVELVKAARTGEAKALATQRIVDGLDRGRRNAIAKARARSEAHASVIQELAAADIAAGRPSWGRAGRISRKMGAVLKERQVRRILDRLSVRPIRLGTLQPMKHSSQRGSDEK